MALTHGPRDLTCSARGCREGATTAIRWRNPSIPRHRTKTWLACPEHVDFLADYMRYRSFPYEFVPIEDLRTQDGADG
ncbi:hypothetical protein M3T53_05785 [Actinomyces sp. B33]|uniref:hypothetical protein n=1 Tax=Actinomyces sp. B33 TaxID=2942131 RepID=UPI0023408296|nr:hypothetical protein [Actinomyces sp. B33]MDC4233220.1 hypothetical protein [Actinomyces sp. B33]